VTASDDPRGEARNQSATEALGRAQRHARFALAETLAAIHALLDAASLSISDKPAKSHSLLSPVAAFLEAISAQLDGGDGREAVTLLHSIAAALDEEIARWETRAETDPDARAVLRAFLGLRELMWEFGVRREATPSQADEESERNTPKAGRAPSTRSKKRRVERVPVEGS
jgi:hypothetical protein